MQLKDIMTPEVERIHKDENLQKAAQWMKALNVGLIPIYDGDRLVGMLTDRDITVRATAAGCDPARVSSPGNTGTIRLASHSRLWILHPSTQREHPNGVD